MAIRKEQGDGGGGGNQRRMVVLVSDGGRLLIFLSFLHKYCSVYQERPIHMCNT